MRWGIALLLLSGCASWIETNRAVYGPFGDRSEAQLFEDVQRRVVARGYRPIDADAARGQFAVRSMSRGPDGHVTFRFRFYRGGWIGTDVGGAGARRTSDGRLRLPVPVWEEYARLVVDLMDEGPR